MRVRRRHGMMEDMRGACIMRIWTGRAASGKTTAILREIADRCERGEGRQVLLVPELHSHRMERRLAEATGNHGARTAEVLTFSRLADRVFSEVGGLAEQMLTPAGQLLTLQPRTGSLLQIVPVPEEEEE